MAVELGDARDWRKRRWEKEEKESAPRKKKRDAARRLRAPIPDCELAYEQCVGPSASLKLLL